MLALQTPKGGAPSNSKSKTELAPIEYQIYSGLILLPLYLTSMRVSMSQIMISGTAAKLRETIVPKMAGGPGLSLFATPFHRRIIPLLQVHVESRVWVGGCPVLDDFQGRGT